MSKENVKKFYQEVVKNESLFKKLNAINVEAMLFQKKVIENVVTLAKSEGINFSVNDFVEVQKEIMTGVFNTGIKDSNPFGNSNGVSGCGGGFVNLC